MNNHQESIVADTKRLMEEMHSIYYRGLGSCKTDQEREQYKRDNQFWQELPDAMARILAKYKKAYCTTDGKIESIAS